MTNAWILKTEPTSYSWDDLVRERSTVWNGVSSPAALIQLRAIRRGDEVLIYHSGKQKAIVGIARVTRGAYPDPALDDPRRVVVDIAAVRPVKQPVTLAEIKADPQLASLALVRQSRLSCLPVSAGHRVRLARLGAR